MTSIAAIAPPSAYLRGPAPSGGVKLRQLLGSDAIAVRPIQPIPDEEKRRQSRGSDSSADSPAGSATDASANALDDSVRRSRGPVGGPIGDGVRSRPLGSSSGTDETRTSGGDVRPNGPPPPPAPPPTASAAASPNTGFLTQSIAQESIGKGLHIEPWRAAINAYRRAGAEPREALVSNVSV